MRLDFASPTRVVFGPGTLAQAGPLLQPHGQKVLVVTGRTPARAQRLLSGLGKAGMAASIFKTDGEPTIAIVTRGVAACHQSDADLVLGLGGGSAIDAAKAIAALATNPGDPLDYLEVIGKGQPLTRPPLPFIAIPTTAGTGSEVTRNAVLGSPAHNVKVSLRSPLMPAKVAIVDPELTLDLPPEVTATTGMDALTQCIEAYVSCKATPLTDAFCIDGIRRAAQSLRRVFHQGNDLNARSDMALASLYSGIALAHAGLGAVHGFAGPIGGMFPAPHGAVCAALLPEVMKVNLDALRRREPGSAALPRFTEIAQWITEDPAATADEGVRWLKQLRDDLRIPPLRHWGVKDADIPEILPKARAASSMKGNPLHLENSELRQILTAAL